MKKLIALSIVCVGLSGCPTEQSAVSFVEKVDPVALVSLMGEYVEWRAKLQMEIEDLGHEDEDYEAFRLAVTKAKIVDQTLQRLTTPEALRMRPMEIER